MIIDGKTLANEYMASLQHGFAEYGKPVRLSLIAVHPDDVVQRYMRAKQRFGERVGVEVVVHTVTQPMSQHDLEALIVNVAKNSDGVVLQLPVRGYDTSALLAAIPAEKDVDVLIQFIKKLKELE
jgi:5,10-methylene-tetrahydrofolate dehydrogenase/methenyl tetrahydrofolate cyclohydrolase